MKPHTRVPSFFWGRTSSFWGWWSPGTGCPGRLWSLLLWRSSRPAWTRSCAACCKWPCFGRGVGLGDPQRSLPTPNILWFCDSWVCHSFCHWANRGSEESIPLSSCEGCRSPLAEGGAQESADLSFSDNRLSFLAQEKRVDGSWGFFAVPGQLQMLTSSATACFIKEARKKPPWGKFRSITVITTPVSPIWPLQCYNIHLYFTVKLHSPLKSPRVKIYKVSFLTVETTGSMRQNYHS